MSVEALAIDGVWAVRHPTLDDERGFFHQTSVLDELIDAAGELPSFVQGNHARSHPGVLRGFHAEPWHKLVYVASGTVQAVVADVRPHSPTFGQHVSLLLGDAPGERTTLLVASGLANSYCVLGEQPADYIYSVSQRWTPDAERLAIAWDDPTLAVPWELRDPILSPQDAAAPTLRDCFGDHPMFA